MITSDIDRSRETEKFFDGFVLGALVVVICWFLCVVL